MQLEHHLAQVHDQLAAAAALGDDRTREVAAALATATASAVRLALLQAITEAADEMTAALLDYPGSPAVSVHIEGDDIGLDVRASQPATEADDRRREDSDANARISLRLSEALKAEIDAAAEADGVSVNTWLVRAASAALRPGPFGAGAQFGSAFGPAFGGPGAESGRGRQRRDTSHRITGWING
jgi:HicB family